MANAPEDEAQLRQKVGEPATGRQVFRLGTISPWSKANADGDGSEALKISERREEDILREGMSSALVTASCARQAHDVHTHHKTERIFWIFELRVLWYFDPESCQALPSTILRESLEDPLELLSASLEA